MKRIIAAISALFFLDQLTKYLVVRSIPYGLRIEIIPNFFDLVHVTNKGAAFGFMSDFSEPWRSLVLGGFSLIAIALVIYYMVHLGKDAPHVRWPLAMILGGAFGNVFDRFFRGSVVDFLSVHWYDRSVTIFGSQIRLEWPAFNVADSAITVSVIILLFMLSKKPDRIEQ
jgi:signal peptidase II